MQLFKQKTDMTKTASFLMGLTMEKNAYTKLSESSDNWLQEIEEQAVQQLPSISKEKRIVDITERDDESGFAKGEVIVGGKFSLPFVIKEFKLSKFNVMIVQGKPYPATRNRILELLFNSKHAARLATKEDIKLFASQRPVSGPLQQSLGVLDSDYFGEGKLASDYDYFVEGSDYDMGLSVTYRGINNKEVGSFNIHKFASDKFFHSLGVNPSDCRDKIAYDGCVSIPFSRTYKELSIKNKNFHNFGAMNKVASYRVHEKNGRVSDGIFLKKVANSYGADLEDVGLFLDGKNFSSGLNLAGETLPFDIPLKKIASDPQKSDRGYMVFDGGSTKVAFGPIKFITDLRRVSGRDFYKVATQSNVCEMVIDPYASKATIIPETNKIVFPAKVAFVKALGKINHINDKDLVKESSDSSASFFYKQDEFGFHIKKGSDLTFDNQSFRTKGQLATYLSSKGFFSGEIGKIINHAEAKKWNAMDAINDRHVNNTGHELPQESATIDSSLTGDTMKLNTLETMKSASDYTVNKVLENISFYQPITKDDQTKIANESMQVALVAKKDLDIIFNKSAAAKEVYEVLGIEDSKDSMKKFFESLDKIEEVSSVLSQLLLKARMGDKNLPENNLEKVVESLGVVVDSLKILNSNKK